jgi:hypothetical protein
VSDCATTGEAARTGEARPATRETAWSYVTATLEAGTPIKARASVEAGPTVVAAAVEPWAGADEDAAGKVARTVVAVRRAGVWVLSVVAIGADGCRANISRATHAYAHSDAAYSNADSHPLCMRIRRERCQGANQSQNL